MQVGLEPSTRNESPETNLGRGGQIDGRDLDAGHRRIPTECGALGTGARPGHGQIGDPETEALDPQAGHVEQGVCGPRQGAEPVLPLGGDIIDLLVGPHRGQPTVGLEPCVLGRDVGGRQVGGVGDVDGQVEGLRDVARP